MCKCCHDKQWISSREGILSVAGKKAWKSPDDSNHTVLYHVMRKYQRNERVLFTPLVVMLSVCL